MTTVSSISRQSPEYTAFKQWARAKTVCIANGTCELKQSEPM